MDLAALVSTMIDQMAFWNLTNDPLAGYGKANDVYLGAALLPERPVMDNMYTETAVRYRTPIANHGTRYSPVQLKSGQISGSIRVELGYSDVGDEFNTEDYDQLIRLMQRVHGTTGNGPSTGSGIAVPEQKAMVTILNWAERSLHAPLLVRNEKDRWDAIVNAQIVMQGDNGFTETVNYSNPLGHRVNAGGTWSSDAYDPWPDIISMAEFLRMKGYEVGRILIPVQVRTILANNLNMRLRAGRISVAYSVVTGIPGRLTEETLATLLNTDGLPPFELYDKQYYTQNTATTTATTRGVAVTGNWFLPRNCMVFIAKTGRDEEIDRGDLEPVVQQDTLGYVGIGRPAGASKTGRCVEVKYEDAGKNKGLTGQGWQASLPVILEPEAIAVINNIG